MIYEYALEPEFVATWAEVQNCRFFFHEFGPGPGRLVSRYPKKWASKVWESFSAGSDMEKKRMEELLVRLQNNMVKRKDFVWDNARESWLENALLEHARYPFRAILAKNNPSNRPEIIGEDAFVASPRPTWDCPHGIMVKRKAQDMADCIKGMLSCCLSVKFIDPYFSKCKYSHKQTLREFLNILNTARPVGQPETIEIHTREGGATMEYIKEFYEKIIPKGMIVTLFQWQERPGGQRLHNRYILTDLGGVSFHHGLDSGNEGETDDITRLDLDQYNFRLNQYDPKAPAFDQAADPLVLSGKL